MAWELLPTDYTDAVWDGLKKYLLVENADGTVSFEDKTEYSNLENSFFGAKEANRMNNALNILMSMVENGSNLYEEFQDYFDTQKGLFEDETDSVIDQLEQAFTEWFEGIKSQLTEDVAGSLQTQCTELDERLSLLEYMTMQNDFSAPLATDDETTTLLTDDTDYAILAEWKYKEK